MHKTNKTRQANINGTDKEEVKDTDRLRGAERQTEKSDAIDLIDLFVPFAQSSFRNKNANHFFALSNTWIAKYQL